MTKVKQTKWQLWFCDVCKRWFFTEITPTYCPYCRRQTTLFTAGRSTANIFKKWQEE